MKLPTRWKGFALVAVGMVGIAAIANATSVRAREEGKAVTVVEDGSDLGLDIGAEAIDRASVKKS